MNLNLFAVDALGEFVPKVAAELHLYDSDTLDEFGNNVNNYHAPIPIELTKQKSKPTDLQHINNIESTSEYWNMWINYHVPSPPLRNVTGGDFILSGGIKYKIVSIVEDFETWCQVIGVRVNDTST
ncbi:MAG: hypothetical protein EKK64_04980 [Neisseriaceae bacterium]|nr:MAG: hypothetical protein EKK64_04980 [Neisseriaceae bacterium]